MNAAEFDAAVRLHAGHGAMSCQDPLTDAVCDTVCDSVAHAGTAQAWQESTYASTLPQWLASTLEPIDASNAPPRPLPPQEGMWSIEAENPWVCLGLYLAVLLGAVALSWAKNAGWL